MNNVVQLDRQKIAVEQASRARQLKRSIRDLDDAIKTVEANLLLQKSKRVRNSINMLKNARYLLQTELDSIQRVLV